MKVLIISGGSGNSALMNGLIQLYPDVDIKVLLNAYDNGKSTGACRFVTDTLGVSDIRKNHIKMYKALVPKEEQNEDIVAFYDTRVDLPEGRECETVIEYLHKWSLEFFDDIVKKFFRRTKSRLVKYNDFSISNIVYSEMYADIGYEATNNYMCANLLHINDFVVFNSYDQVYIDAVSVGGNIIKGEEKIVEYKTYWDPIKEVLYDVKNESIENSGAVEAIEWADLIVISSGTFWASLYPTLEYKGLYTYINKSSAKKVWVMNNNQDADCYGVDSNELIQHLETLGLDLKQFVILQNYDADESLKLDNLNYNIRRSKMGNLNGKHDPVLLATEIYKIYYGIESNFYSKIFIDFDGTIAPRNTTNISEEEYTIEKENIKLVNSLGSTAVIVSGNTFGRIQSCLSAAIPISKFIPDVWADSSSTLYSKGELKDYISLNLIDGVIGPYICSSTEEELKKLGLSEYTHEMTNSDESLVGIKIKPLQEQYRVILVMYLNDYYFMKNKLPVQARITGRTTVDILNSNNDKVHVIKKYEDKLTLFIGDEVNKGNDELAAKKCMNSICVKDIYETNLILRLLVAE